MINGNIVALERFCELTIEGNRKGDMRDFQWWCQGIIRPQMSSGLLQKMKIAGCYQITYGVESGSQKVVDLMGKRFSIDEAHEIIRNTHQAGILVTAIFMFGFPGEGRVDFDKTLKFIEKSRDYIDETIPAEGFCVIERHSLLYKNAEHFGLYLNPHPFYWKTPDGENNYIERFSRFEEFCKKAVALGMKLTGSYDKNRQHKEEFLKEYSDYSDSVDLNICGGLVTKEPSDKIRFLWHINPACNLSCAYCEDGREVTRYAQTLFLSPEEWEAAWKRVYDAYGQLEIFITGGEPLLYPHFLKLAKRLSCFHMLTISTNLSMEFDKIQIALDPRRVRFNINFHAGQAELEPLIKKAILLKKAGFSLAIYYLAHPSQIAQIPNISRQLIEAGLEFKLTGFWGAYQGKRYPESYTEEEERMLKPYLGDKRRMLYNLQGESPKGKLCNAGYKSAVIKSNGDALRCRYAPEETMGNICDSSFSLFSEPAVCNKEFCPYNEFDTVI